MKRIVLKVDGMMCQNNCGTTVHNALMSVHGVHSANVSFATHSASILLSPGDPPIDSSKLIQAIDDIGFEASLIETTKPSHVFKVFGMMCQKNCGSTVENALRNIPGVLWAKVDFPTQTAEVWDGNAITDQNVFKDAVEDVGFEVLFDGPMSKETSSAGSDEDPDNIYLSEKKITQLDIPKIRELLLSIDGVLSLDIDLPHHLIKVWGFADTPFVQKMLKDSGFPTHVFDSLNDALNYQKERKQRMLSPPASNIPAERTVIQDNGHTFVAHLLVGGMSCANCAKSIESNLTKRSGILSVRVALLSGRVEVVYDETTFGKFEQLPQIITSLGYSAKFEGNPHRYGSMSQKRSKKLRVKISGMSCGSSAKDIENRVKQLNGVVEVDVSIKTNLGNFVLEDSSLNGGVGPRTVIEEIEKMGYWCKHIPSQDQDELGNENLESADIQEWWRLLVISLMFGLPVMFLHLSMILSNEMMMMLDQPGMCDGSLSRDQTLMAILNTPLQIIVGYRFYRGAFLSAMHGSFGMDCLVVTGTTITFVYSSLQLFFACYSGVSSDHMFFETSGMLLMFVTIGKYIEAYAKGATASAMTSLLKLQPRKAFLVSNMIHSPLSESPSCYTTTSTHSSLTTPPQSPTATNTIDLISDDDWIENEVKEIDLELLDRNDIIKVFPGERFPTDGEVVRGSSYVDESLITGESVPVLRGVGSTVYGSTVNQKGLIYIRVTSLGDDTALSQIVKMIEAAQMNKAPIQAYADQVAGVFTPTVLTLAVFTFLVWFLLASNKLIPTSWMHEAGYGKDPVLFSLLFSISVVVISCPCALGLATPTAIMVGTSVGATNGILIKGGPPFEIAHRIDTIIFDKTGTLTVGKPILTDELLVTEPSNMKQFGATLIDQKNHMLKLAALAEQCSEHPLASAVVNAAKARHLDLPDNSRADYSIHTGGVKCSFPDGTCILVGNRSHMETNHVVLGPIIDSTMWDIEIQGKTAVCVAFNSMIIGVLGIADVIKPEALSTISALKERGIDLWMVTGDNRTTALAIGDELEIPQDRVIAGSLPGDKLSKVISLQEAGKCVAMVGDGINDSPAISQADLGIAIGAGTHIAIDAADLVVVRSNLHDVVVALDLAKCVFSRIKWNLMWALLYNVLAIPIAAGAIFPLTHTILPPQYAGLCMALSSISVVISSMALKLYTRPVITAPAARDGTGGGSKSMIGRARERISKLKAEFGKRIDELRGNGPYNVLSAVDDDDDDLGMELGLGGLKGLPPTLEYEG